MSGRAPPTAGMAACLERAPGDAVFQDSPTATSMRLLLLALLLPAAAFAQNVGSLSGTVTDDSGETLPGATVFLPQIQRGAATDIDGNYTIIGIPVGVYEVQFSSVGFGAQTIDDIQISRDRTRQLDIALAVGQEISCGIWLGYERPIISADIYSPRILAGEDLENRPDRFNDGLRLTAAAHYTR